MYVERVDAPLNLNNNIKSEEKITIAVEYLKRIDPIFLGCCEDEEDSKHVVGECLTPARTKLRYFRLQFMESEMMKASQLTMC